MKNWKTTLIGFAIGALYIIVSALQNGVEIKDAVLAGGVFLLGALAKDFNVTGGNIKQ